MSIMQKPAVTLGPAAASPARGGGQEGAHAYTMGPDTKNARIKQQDS